MSTLNGKFKENLDNAQKSLMNTKSMVDRNIAGTGSNRLNRLQCIVYPRLLYSMW